MVTNATAFSNASLPRVSITPSFSTVCSARFFLIGTHKDVIKSHAEHERVESILRSELHGMLEHVCRNDHDDLIFFPVDNTLGATGDPTLQSLRKSIESAVFDDPEEYIKEPVAASWHKALDALHETQEQFLLLDRVISISTYHGVAPDAVHAMLALFHKLGVLVHFSSPELRNIVTIEPQWLVDAVTLIIRDRGLHLDDIQQKAKQELRSDYNSLNDSAILSNQLLDLFWRDYRIEQRSFLRGLMLKMTLFCRWTSTSFLVPSLLPMTSPAEPITSPAFTVAQWPLTFVCRFSEILPDGLFERLLCVVIDHAHTAFEHWRRRDRLKLSRLNATLTFGLYIEFKLQLREKEVNVTIKRKEDAARVRRDITDMLQKVCIDVMHGLSFEVLVQPAMETIQPRPFVSWSEVEAKHKQEKTRWRDHNSGEEVQLSSFNDWFVENIPAIPPSRLAAGCSFHFQIVHCPNLPATALKSELTLRGFKCCTCDRTSQLATAAVEATILFVDKDSIAHPHVMAAARAALRLDRPLCVVRNNNRDDGKFIEEEYQIKDDAPEDLRSFFDSVSVVPFSHVAPAFEVDRNIQQIRDFRNEAGLVQDTAERAFLQAQDELKRVIAREAGENSEDKVWS